MRLRRFEAKNFKAIKSISVDWDDLLVLIGENNCGKSCLLLTLSCFLNGSAIKDESFFHKYETGPDDAIELVGYFDQLTDQDKNEVAVKGRMNGAVKSPLSIAQESQISPPFSESSMPSAFHTASSTMRTGTIHRHFPSTPGSQGPLPLRVHRPPRIS